MSTAPLAASANCRELASFQCSLDCFRTLDPDANAGTPNISQSSDCTEVSSTRNNRSVSEWSRVVMGLIEDELAELRKTLENAVQDAKLQTCVHSSVRVEIT